MLDRILQNCLQDDPRERYGSFEELLSDLGLAIETFKTTPRRTKLFRAIRKLHKSKLEDRLPDHPAELAPEPRFWMGDALSQGVVESDLSPPGNECSSVPPDGTVQAGSVCSSSPGTLHEGSDLGCCLYISRSICSGCLLCDLCKARIL